MTNSLLDFVMSLVRDSEAAAQYAADPAQAIADANLTDVTSADVNQLIPVVAESLSSAMPTTGVDGFGADAVSNVWASGAATAAFDAFDDHLPQQVLDDPHGVINDLIGTSDDAVFDTAAPSYDVPTVAGLDDPALQLDAPVIDDLPVDDAAHETEWVQHVIDDDQSTPDAPGFEDLI
ncbi:MULTISPECIES: Rv0340 family IniB-related protein [unclassified Mycobacterium]|uniref:Rv0340 family IniB-related protein n=1 Tax=unclassified Mycobacterium TaxID=2642494 RepID=UPI0029C72322|nr:MULTISPECIES: Rv0340 family IniB-related protein [unclassified Mycobacterium]